MSWMNVFCVIAGFIGGILAVFSWAVLDLREAGKRRRK